MPYAEGKEFNGVDRIVEENFGLGIDSRDAFHKKSMRDPLLHCLNPFGIPNIVDKLPFHKISVHAGKVDFQVCMDVSHFTPNELTVMVAEETVIVKGEHGERKDDHGFIKRQFMREYYLPEGTDPKNVVSTLSSDGVLTIKAPVQNSKAKSSNERIVRIQPTGCSHEIVKQPEKWKNQQNGIRDTNRGTNQTQKTDPAHLTVKQAEESKNQKTEETGNISKGNSSVKQPEQSKNQPYEKNDIKGVTVQIQQRDTAHQSVEQSEKSSSN